MIILCDDERAVESAIMTVSGDYVMSDMLMLYLRSYGCKYDFATFYVQFSDTGEVLCALLRFDSSIYCHTVLPINRELSDFLLSFSGLFLYVPTECSGVLQAKTVEYGCFMQKDKTAFLTDTAGVCGSNATVVPVGAKGAAMLARQYIADKAKAENFYLRISRMEFHNTLKLFGITDESGRLMSCIGVSDIGGRSYVDFLYTDEYFRGNSYGRSLLSFVSADNCVSLMCLCELAPYYESNGFIKVGDWIKYCL